MVEAEMKRFDVLVLVVVCISGSVLQAQGGSSTACVLERLPDLGSIDQRSCRLPYRLGINAAEHLAARQAVVERIRYHIGTDDQGRVKYIGTNDECFRTPEGFSVGTRSSEIRRNLAETALRTEEGITFIELPSGWNAGFPFVGTVDDVTPETEVKWFFRR